MNTTILRRAVLTMAFLPLLLIGCANNEPPPDAPPMTLNVSLTEFAIEADASQIPVGAAVTFNFTNSGLTKHEGVLERDGALDDPLKAFTQTGRLWPEDSHSFTYTFTEPGVYQLACHIDSHYESGMRFEVVVGP